MQALLLSFFLFIGSSVIPLWAQQTDQFPNCQRKPNPSADISSQQGTRTALTENKVTVYYVLPNDAAYSQAEYDAIRKATREVQAWFQINTGGLTYTFAYADTVVVYRGLENTAYYQQDWWGLLLGEMASQGEPIWQQGIVASLWIKTGNAYGIGLGAQACDGYCGVAMAGVENFPEFNDTGVCPTDPEGIMWPCVPHATMAHELGHAFGLPHPADNDSTAAVANHSIMQTHWNYPNNAPENESPWGLLTVERTVLWDNPFFEEDISLRQIYDADVVNLPVTGPEPDVRFKTSVKDRTLTLKNKTRDAWLYYWTFGDGSVSNEKSPSHTYSSPGTYTVTLRASHETGMTALQQETVMIRDTKKPDKKPVLHVGPIRIYPNPSTDGQFTIAFPPIPFTIRITVLNAMGQPLMDQTISDTSHNLHLDMRDFGRGVYYVRLDMQGASLTQKLVIL
ncbi:PDK repeat-containing protein [Pontibacter sp. HJ8]